MHVDNAAGLLGTPGAQSGTALSFTYPPYWSDDVALSVI